MGNHSNGISTAAICHVPKTSIRMAVHSFGSLGVISSNMRPVRVNFNQVFNNPIKFRPQNNVSLRER